MEALGYLLLAVFVIAILFFAIKNGINNVSTSEQQIQEKYKGKNYKQFISTGKLIYLTEDGYISIYQNGTETNNFHINDIADVDIQINAQSVNAGKAVVGGLLFGNVGAILGGLDKKVKNAIVTFYLNDFNSDSITIKYANQAIINSYMKPFLSTIKVIEKNIKAQNK